MGAASRGAATTRGERVSRYSEVSSALAVRSDRQLSQLVGRAEVLGAGIGGTSVLLDVAGLPVFAKQVPLTELELAADNLRSTANLFGLPPFCQYGVGSPGFGAWRELAANVLTTNWVLAGRTAAFPLLYHWRVLPAAAPPTDEHADVERVVRYWGGSPAVRSRLRAVRAATASIVLFQEFIPYNLDTWLAAQVAAGPGAVASASAMVESGLPAALAFLNANGLMHFDAHFGNVLTDGRRLYLADLGLVTSSRFDLSAPEAEFLAHNRTHDAGYAVMHLVNWLVANAGVLTGPDDGWVARRNGYIRACASGGEPVGMPPATAATIRRYAPVAAVMNDFYWELFGVSRATPYPAGRIEEALNAIPAR